MGNSSGEQTPGGATPLGDFANELTASEPSVENTPKDWDRALNLAFYNSKYGSCHSIVWTYN